MIFQYWFFSYAEQLGVLHFLVWLDTLCLLIWSSLACIVLPVSVVWCVTLTCLVRLALLFHLASLSYPLVFGHLDISLNINCLALS